MNQKELEEEQKLIAVNQIRKSELKAKQKMYASSTTFGRKMVSQYTLTFFGCLLQGFGCLSCLFSTLINMLVISLRSIAGTKKARHRQASHWWRGGEI